MAISVFSLKYQTAFKAIEFLGPILGLSLLVQIITVWYLQNSPQQLPITYKLTTPKQIFYLESASTPEQLYKGLKFRNHLPSDRGMLFNLGKRQTHVGFWMYQVSIPLDIIYLDHDQVVKIIDEAPPCRKQPCPIYYAPHATQVLELASSQAKQAGIQLGTKLQFSTSQD